MKQTKRNPKEMERLNGFEEAFMIGDNFPFNFTDDCGISTLKYGGPDSSSNDKPTSFGTQNDPFHVPIEDLKWLMDEEAFPPLDTCFRVLSDGSELMSNHLSPMFLHDTIKTNGVSYNNFDLPVNHPKGARSNRRRRRTAGYGELPGLHSMCSNHTIANIRQESGRRCRHCLSDKTPQWRAGPMGPKTLCNACGVRYKSGRLHPEYRPACSPTFSSVLHSNSHKKVMEMRMKKLGD